MRAADKKIARRFIGFLLVSGCALKTLLARKGRTPPINQE
jgi:hypothetical protein